ncbi:ATPase [Salimicrobium jeotgali]|uniref:histidine kinase n=1 Tax=Salimicrobium jeotgali TaxID=1230341 RepID=K2FK15_9BACI|nr:sensor histidine kinase [Salimicrobium jeotgali]AKG03747.1 ATPase [Salimicrobium jeotgali]EKE31396.1 two-component sensor kinase citS [Salimicrobium jeotgali]MBM7697004.1 CitB family two-component system sensor histidine kinase CitS [Salimicrobium jeotgali]
MNVKLQTKILGLVLSLLLLVTVTFTGAYAFMEKEEVEQDVGQLALQVASTISFMPTVKEAFASENPSEIIQPIAKSVQGETGAEFVVVGNKDGIRYAHPDEWKIGKKMVGGDNSRALKDGEYYTSRAEGTLGPSLRGKAPIISDSGEIIGLVSVGFLIEDIRTMVWNEMETIILIATGVLLLGVIGSLLLARSIRKDTLGLEPYEVTSFYQTREAILSSVKEGIIAIDSQGRVTMINQSALELLGLENADAGANIIDIFPNTGMLRTLQSGKAEQDEEIVLNNKVVIVNRTPIREKGETVGVVSSLRDKTEVREMVNTLSEVKRYSESLRAQTHEYTNRMYVLLGLMQLGNTKEATEMIEQEFTESEPQQKIIFQRIHDDTTQAILTGKISKASEKKVRFKIDEDSSLERLPEHINKVELITILGNIVDNAFEAVQNQKEKLVEVFITDIGNDIIFSVTDNGPGIPEDMYESIFQKGSSTKDGVMRGYGLWNVQQIIDKLGGTIEILDNTGGGTVFSVFLPKERDRR